MKSVGVFEAKTRFSEICHEIAVSGVAITVTHRGKPLVRIEPIHNEQLKSKNVWDYRDQYVQENGPLTEEFDLPRREPQSWRNPFDE